MKSIEQIAEEKYPEIYSDIPCYSPSFLQLKLRAAFIAGSKYGKEWISVETKPEATGNFSTTI